MQLADTTPCPSSLDYYGTHCYPSTRTKLNIGDRLSTERVLLSEYLKVERCKLRNQKLLVSILHHSQFSVLIKRKQPRITKGGWRNSEWNK